jgi:hypothetical protein
MTAHVVGVRPFIAQPWSSTANADKDDSEDSDAELEKTYQEQTGMDQTPEPTPAVEPAVLDYSISIVSIERNDVRSVHDFEDGKPYTCDGQREGIALYFANDEKVWAAD